MPDIKIKIFSRYVKHSASIGVKQFSKLAKIMYFLIFQGLLKKQVSKA
jgi:hypothetical protein